MCSEQTQVRQDREWLWGVFSQCNMALGEPSFERYMDLVIFPKEAAADVQSGLE